MPYSIDTKNIDMMIKTSLLPITQIEFLGDDIFKKQDKDKKKSIYPLINKYMTIRSLDEIDLFWELFYPEKELKRYDECKDVYLLDLLKNFARTFLSHRDGRIVFKYWESDSNKYFKVYKGISKVLLWNSINRYFTTDILGILYMIDNNMNHVEYLKGYYSSVALEDMQLESILKKGTAETHLHISASTDFYTSWKNLMNLYKDNKEEIQYDRVIGSKPFNLSKYYKIASITRLIMTYFLIKYKKQNCFGCFIEEIPYLKSEQNKINKLFYKEPKLNTYILQFLQESHDKYEQFTGDDLTMIFKALFEDIFGIGYNLNNDERNDLRVNTKDILDYIIFDEEDNFENDMETYTENIFLMKAINYIYANNSDEVFSNSFINYLRIKNEFFSFMVQGNEIKGLDNFVNYFRRSTKIGKYENKEICWKERLRAQFKDKNLKKLEIRISPADVYKDKKGAKIKKSAEIETNMCKELLLIFQAYKEILEESVYLNIEGTNCYTKSMKVPYLGIVYHFIKKQDLPIHQKCWFNYENDKNKEKENINYENLYYEKLKYEYKLQADTIIKIRKEIPRISHYIVGIDGASIENHTEPWVFAEIYDELRDSKHSMYGATMEPLNTLGFTFHAGEDFRHLLTGLRRIDETIDRYKFHAGDRIGHGIAIGVDIKRWIEKNPVVTIPRIEYLENLIWIWGSYKHKNNAIDIGYLERKIMECSKDIYINTEGITVYNLWEAYENKFKNFINNTRKIKNKEHKENCEDYLLKEFICCPNADFDNVVWDKDKLIRANHCKKYLSLMIEPIQIEVSKEDTGIIEEMQKLVIKKASNKGIIVETNPTSNSSIGEVENVFNHYITRLNTLESANDLESLMISINTDDPSVFNTNLSNEFAYIFYSLVHKGYSKEKILKWIDKIREHGMNSSFIKNRYEESEEIIKELEIIIKKLRERLNKNNE